MNRKIISTILIIVGMLCFYCLDNPFLNFLASFFIIAGIIGMIKDKKAQKRELYEKYNIELNINSNQKNKNLSSELEFSIKGMIYTNAKTLLDDYFITEGTQLEVKPELNNTYDKNAMLVLYKGEKIGYVEKECAALVKQFYNKGCKICYVDKVKRYDDNYFVLVTMPFK